MVDTDRTQAPRITQEMIALFDDYTHLSLDRRKCMDTLAKLDDRGCGGADGVTVS